MQATYIALCSSFSGGFTILLVLLHARAWYKVDREKDLATRQDIMRKAHFWGHALSIPIIALSGPFFTTVHPTKYVWLL